MLVTLASHHVLQTVETYIRKQHLRVNAGRLPAAHAKLFGSMVLSVV